MFPEFIFTLFPGSPVLCLWVLEATTVSSDKRCQKQSAPCLTMLFEWKPVWRNGFLFATGQGWPALWYCVLGCMLLGMTLATSWQRRGKAWLRPHGQSRGSWWPKVESMGGSSSTSPLEQPDANQALCSVCLNSIWLIFSVFFLLTFCWCVNPQHGSKKRLRFPAALSAPGTGHPVITSRANGPLPPVPNKDLFSLA